MESNVISFSFVYKLSKLCLRELITHTLRFCLFVRIYVRCLCLSLFIYLLNMVFALSLVLQTRINLNKRNILNFSASLCILLLHLTLNHL